MNSFLLTIAAVLVVALGALFMAPYMIDWTHYRDVIQAEASELIGRDVKIKGDINIRLLPAPYMDMQSVEITDAKGAGDAPFLEIKSFTLWLSFPPLLRGAFEVRKIAIIEPSLHLHINKAGTINWQNIEPKVQQISSLSEKISLASVVVKNAKLELTHASSKDPLTLDHVNGMFSASTLAGPYKFTGYFLHRGQRRNIDFSTGSQTSKGSMRLKGGITNPTRGNSYRIDGNLKSLDDNPHFSGVFIGRFSPPIRKHIASPEDNKKGTDSTWQTQQQGPAQIEIKSALSASLKKAIFKNLIFSFEQQSRPQLLKGEAVLDWHEGLNLNGRLTARVLDFDQIYPATEQVLDLPFFVSLSSSLLRQSAPYFNKVAFHAQIEQANLADDLIHDFDLHLTKDDQSFEIAELSMRVPGHNRLSLRGRLSPVEEGLDLTGYMVVEGQNFGRLLNWAFPHIGISKGTTSESYALRGAVNLAPGRIEIDSFQGEFAEAAFGGTFRLHSGHRRKLVAELESEDLDLTHIFGDEISIAELRDLFWRSGKTSGGTKNATPSKTAIQAPLSDFLRSTEAKINVRIGHLLLADFDGQDLVAEVNISQGRLEIKKLHLESDDGFILSMGGQIDALAEQSQGQVQLAIEALTERGLKTVGKIFSLPSDILNNRDQMQALNPLQLTLLMEMSRGARQNIAVKIDGAAAESQFSVEAIFAERMGKESLDKESLDKLYSQKIDLMGEIRSPRGLQLARQLGAKLSLPEEEFEANDEAHLTFQGRGVPEKGVEGLLKLTIGKLEGGFSGTLTLDALKHSIKGNLHLIADDANQALALIGLTPDQSPTKQPLDLKADFKREGSRYHLSALRGSFGTSQVRGEGMIDLAKEPFDVNVKVRVDEADLPGLLRLGMQRQDSNFFSQVENMVGEQGSYWGKRTFRTDFLSRFQGRISAEADVLHLGEGLPLKDSEVTALFKHSSVYLRVPKGELFGGAFSAATELRKSRRGLHLSGLLSLSNADLKNVVSRQGQTLARGALDFKLSFAGEGLSPRGLVSVLKGQGELSIGKGEVFHLAPDAISKIAEERVNKLPSERLPAALRKAFQSGSFPISPLTTQLAVNHGIIQFEQVTLFGDETTKAQISARFEIADLRFNHEWMVSSKIKDQDEALPVVKISFSGPLSSYGQVTPRIEIGSLARYLLVRRMERDVERLEELQSQQKIEPPVEPQAETPGEPQAEPQIGPQAEPSADKKPLPEAAILRPAALSPEQTSEPIVPQETEPVIEELPPAVEEPSLTANSPPLSDPLPATAPIDNEAPQSSDIQSSSNPSSVDTTGSLNWNQNTNVNANTLSNSNVKIAPPRFKVPKKKKLNSQQEENIYWPFQVF